MACMLIAQIYRNNVIFRFEKLTCGIQNYRK